MLTHVIDQITQAIALTRRNAYPVFHLLLGLWAVHLVNFSVGYRLNLLGLYPRRVHGLLGLFFMPFLHADFNHIFLNSIPFFVLTSMVLIKGWYTFYWVSVWILLLSGIVLWCLGRRGIHVGMSVMNMGYMGYLIAVVYFSPSPLGFLIGALCFYYFGSMLGGVMPTDGRESWEGHLFGLLAGIMVAHLMRMPGWPTFI